MKIILALVVIFGAWITLTSVDAQLMKRENQDFSDEDYDIDYSNYMSYYENYETDDDGSSMDEMGETELLGKGMASVATLAKGMTDIEHIRKFAKTGLVKLGKALTKMGGVMKCAGFLVTALQIFIRDPEKEESPELKFLKKKFGEFNGRLDAMMNQMNDIETALEYQGAKVSFGQYARKIKSMKRHLDYALKSPNEKRFERNKAFFMDAFTTSYDDSAMVLFESLMGRNQDYFGYDMLEVTSKKLKCNVNMMSQMCIVTSKTLMDALTVEGAYFGFRNMTWRVKTEGNSWRKRMKELGDRCQKMVDKCANDWKIYAEPIVNSVYGRKQGASNADLADEMFNQLSNNLPQRAWAVFVYKDAYGFGPHTVTKINDDTFMKWHAAGKCVTVNSVDIRRSHFDPEKSKAAMNGAIKLIDNCGVSPPGDPALRLVKAIQKSYGYFPGGCMYAVQKNLDLQTRITANHSESLKVKKVQNCRGKTTGYDHTMVVFN